MDIEPPELRALSNDVVLDLIFGLLKTPDLLRCRKVSRKWNVGVTSTLKRRCVCVRIIGRDAREYDKLLQVMKTSPDFPFRGLRFTFDGERKKDNTLDTPSAKQLFKQFGPSFQHFSLYCVVIWSRDLATLLSSFLPNLVTIELGRFRIHRECKGRTTHEALNNLTLPMLRRIKIRSRDDCHMLPIKEADLTILLHAATGLEKIEGQVKTHKNSEGILLAISATNNLDKLSTLTLEYNVKLNAEVYQSLLRNPPSSLTHMSLGNKVWTASGRLSSEFLDCVRAVLVASAETLKSLSIGSVTLPTQGLPPTFPKLKTLILEQTYPVVSFGIGGLYEKFQAVKEIRLVYGNLTEKLIRKVYWEEGVVWSSVEKLVFDCGVSPDGMKLLANAFPSVTHMVVHFEKFFGKKDNWLSAVSSLGQFGSMKKLELLGITGWSSQFHLDKLLTGMPQSICRMLRARPKLQLPEYCSEVMRPYGGIVQLRGTRLKELVLDTKFYDSCGRTHIISKISAWYGLEMIPALRTVARVSHKADVLATTLEEPVKQFVTIVPP